jgi:diaminopimelate decarboxylase
MQDLNYLSYINGNLHLENVPLLDISKQLGTPLYVYSRKNIVNNFLRYTKSLNSKHKIFYAVKANSNIAILNLLSKLGSGFDTVSLGEIRRVEAAQANTSEIIFSGVGKRSDEITYAIQNNINCINVESISELKRIDSIANKLNKIANIALRINPDINPNTHPLISTGQKNHKFGMDQTQCDYIFANKTQFKSVKISGLSYHIGSQITILKPFELAMRKMKTYILSIYPTSPELTHLNIGGGLGINYHQENTPSIEDYTSLVNTMFKNFPLTLYLEPGRSIVAESGILLAKIEYIKANFIILDTGINDIMRPCLYNSWHNVIPLLEPTTTKQDLKTYDLVGPICESSDLLAKDRLLSVQESDYLCITDAGAYCSSMSSNYNSRPKAAEVMVDQDKFYLIRTRETVAELYQAESILPV